MAKSGRLQEVDRRVAAVQAIWDNPLRVTLKPDAAIRSALERGVPPTERRGPSASSGEHTGRSGA